MSLTSKLILGAEPRGETLRALLGEDAEPDTVVTLYVFEVRVDNTVRYCCWSGGELVRNPDNPAQAAPSLTPIGQAACEALMRLPYLYDDDGRFRYSLVFHGMALGKTPLAKKVLDAFRFTADTRALICFVGDLAVELDGQVFKVMNVKDAVAVADIAGMRRPGQ